MPWFRYPPSLMDTFWFSALTSALLLATPAVADSLTEDCDVPTPWLAVDCLQPKLDRRAAKADALFSEVLHSAEALAQQVPEANIDYRSFAEDFITAKQRWGEYAEYQCAAARKLVGSGTDRNNVELICLIRLYDDRIRDLENWDRY